MATKQLSYTAAQIDEGLRRIYELEDGDYVYGGIVTPTTNPAPTGKVFYIATQAGTYTYFGGVEVANGITILTYDGEEWSADVALEYDLSSSMLQAMASKAVTLPVAEEVVGHFVNYNGTIGDNSAVRYRKYEIEPSKIYFFSDFFTGMLNIPPFAWADANGDVIETIGEGITTGTKQWTNEPVFAPVNARYAYLNVQNSRSAQCYCSKAQDIKQNDETDDVRKALGQIASSYMMRTMTPDSVVNGAFISYNGQATSNASFHYKTYTIDGGKVYAYSVSLSATTGIPIIVWYDEDMNVLCSGDIKTVSEEPMLKENVITIAPVNARYARINGKTAHRNSIDWAVLKEAVTDICVTQKVEDLRRDVSTPISLVLSHITDGYFLTVDGTLSSNSSYEIMDFDVTPNTQYVFSGRKGTNSGGWCYLSWYDNENNFIGNSIPVAVGEADNEKTNVYVLSPDNAVLCRVNVVKSWLQYYSFAELRLVSEYGEGDKIMKVVVNNDGSFYIRTRYNDEKDIIIDHYINGNGLISFDAAYIGDKTLVDAALKVSANEVSSHNDSTAPIRSYTQYWHLFAQHGYPVPTFTNSVGMTLADIGATWKDQLDRQYVIGKVTDATVWLLPSIYQDADGHYTRDWHSKLTSDAITSLTYVSGGSTGHYTSLIELASYGEEQLRSIMTHDKRIFAADGNAIQGAGVYFCNEFTVSESQKGYDPATISDWFGGENGAPNLIGASVMAEFTFSYAYKGAQCALNTTIHLLREAKGTYSGIQQQFFFDKGTYKAMFMIPKAKPRNGVELAKPFNSPSSSSTTYVFNRTAEHLDNIDDPVDRQIGFLHDPNTGKYLVGMAAGLSLVSGDTIKAKRNINRPVNSRLLSFSPSNNNKFYVYATDSGVYENGYYPAGYFKEINAYVSYFDPAENVGQVYWYKDGGRYIIYSHCQTVENVLAINVPAIMEGLHLSVLEKTDDAELLTETIQNGKIFVNYNVAGANYITLIAE